MWREAEAMSATPRDNDRMARRNRVTALGAAGLVVAMLGLAYASVPLYRIFCQVTGFNGTTQRAAAAPQRVSDRTMTVRFDANVSSGLDWSFRPEQVSIRLKLGEERLAFYRATNLSNHAVTGSAVFNVSPPRAGAYFNKIQCFCFTEQTLEAGESADMPVSFFVDPDIATDKDLMMLDTITLSYTFYPAAEPTRTSELDKPTPAKAD
jgi:cytochrome c oxidase assembly protein subunit 11